MALGGTKQRALLAMLALDANRAVSVDRLIEGLWGEEPPPTAVKMLQGYISQLRKLLPGAIVQLSASVLTRPAAMKPLPFTFRLIDTETGAERDTANATFVGPDLVPVTTSGR